MQKIYYKRNELLEVEFYQDEDCKIPFDFTDAKNLYIELKDGDITPLLQIGLLCNATPYSFSVFTPYIQNAVKRFFVNGNAYQCGYKIKTLDDITPNLSKYIPENNAVLFLNDNDFQDYNKYFLGSKFSLIQYPILDKCNLRKSLNFTIFLHYGTQSELQKANEVAKELKEKYGVEKVSVFRLHCFVPTQLLLTVSSFLYREIDGRYNYALSGYKMGKICQNIDKIITTNSTGILKPENDEKLHVIDCFDIFNDAL